MMIEDGPPGSMAFLGAPSAASSCLKDTGSCEMDAELSGLVSSRFAYSDMAPRAGAGAGGPDMVLKNSDAVREEVSVAALA